MTSRLAIGLLLGLAGVAIVTGWSPNTNIPAEQRILGDILIMFAAASWALSTIIILMLINGFTICEMFNLPMSGTAYRVGSFLPGVTGALGFLFLWGDSESRLALAIPTSVFGLCLLPLAYITFILLMNNRTVLGDNMLRGGKRTAMNIAMGVAFVAASIGGGFAIWSKTKFYFGSGWYGVGAVAVLVVLAIVIRPKPGDGADDAPATQAGEEA